MFDKPTGLLQFPFIYGRITDNDIYLSGRISDGLFRQSFFKKGSDGVLPGYEHVKGAMVQEKLDAVLAKEFPQYTVEHEVIVTNNTCVSAAYKRSRELSEANGYTLINFVAAFENRMDYIVNRLHQYL